MKKRLYVPDRGDLVWLDFNPRAGSEQAGKRPALVLSPQIYNGKVGLALFCPITSKVKGYPFEVPIAGKIKGVVLTDQIKSLDWRVRDVVFIARVKPTVLAEVLENIQLLLG